MEVSMSYCQGLTLRVPTKSGSQLVNQIGGCQWIGFYHTQGFNRPAVKDLTYMSEWYMANDASSKLSRRVSGTIPVCKYYCGRLASCTWGNVFKISYVYLCRSDDWFRLTFLCPCYCIATYNLLSTLYKLPNTVFIKQKYYVL